MLHWHFLVEVAFLLLPPVSLKGAEICGCEDRHLQTEDSLVSVQIVVHWSESPPVQLKLPVVCACLSEEWERRPIMVVDCLHNLKSARTWLMGLDWRLFGVEWKLSNSVRTMGMSQQTFCSRWFAMCSWLPLCCSWCWCIDAWFHGIDCVFVNRVVVQKHRPSTRVSHIISEIRCFPLHSLS